MKWRSLAWIVAPALIVLAAYGGNSYYWRRQWTIFRGTDPVLECPGLIELGERELGEIAIARLTIANRGGRELVIDELDSNCACSGLEREQGGEFVRLSSLRLAPHEEVELVMRVSVQGLPGNPSQSRVTFRSNDPTHPRSAIDTWISRVKAGVTTVPTSVVFGTVAIQSAERRVLEVFDSSVKPRAVERVESLENYRVQVRLLPLGESQSPNSQRGLGALIARLEVTASTKVPGPLQTEVAIYLQGESRPPTLIPVNGRVMAPVEVSPSILALPRSSSSGPVYFGQCVCRSSARKPFALNIDSVAEGLLVRVDDAESSASEKVVRIEWEPGHDKIGKSVRRRKVQLTAHFDEEAVPIEIPIICIGKGDG